MARKFKRSLEAGEGRASLFAEGEAGKRWLLWESLPLQRTTDRQDLSNGNTAGFPLQIRCSGCKIHAAWGGSESRTERPSFSLPLEFPRKPENAAATAFCPDNSSGFRILPLQIIRQVCSYWLLTMTTWQVFTEICLCANGSNVKNRNLRAIRISFLENSRFLRWPPCACSLPTLLNWKPRMCFGEHYVQNRRR